MCTVSHTWGANLRKILINLYHYLMFVSNWHWNYNCWTNWLWSLHSTIDYGVFTPQFTMESRLHNWLWMLSSQTALKPHQVYQDTTKPHQGQVTTKNYGWYKYLIQVQSCMDILVMSLLYTTKIWKIPYMSCCESIFMLNFIFRWQLFYSPECS